MTQTRRLTDARILDPAQVVVALKLITEMDFLRLKAIARLYARGLSPDVGWDDLLQEAFTRVILGSRKQPGDVPTVAFIAGILRSLRSEHWRRADGGSRVRRTRSIEQDAEVARDVALIDAASNPERALSARQELAAIERLFADDHVALQIIASLGKGLAAEQICGALRISKTDYDSARKRMRRKLLREGLTCAV